LLSKDAEDVVRAKFTLILVQFLAFMDLFLWFIWRSIRQKEVITNYDLLASSIYEAMLEVWVIFPTYLMNLILINFVFLIWVIYRGKRHMSTEVQASI
jgi:sensor histidine kinase YesM